MKHLFTLTLITLVCLVFSGCTKETDLTPTPPITSFEECVTAGNPVMESYPRQCRSDGETFVEEIPPLTPPDEEEPMPPKDTSFTQCTEKPNICYDVSDPVCGMIDNGIRCVTTPCASTDAKTISNDCDACAEGALGYHPGACEERTFVVCTETVTGFDPEEYAQNVNGICVDICPGNYDMYTTQTGIQVCIKQFSKEDIASWETCTASFDYCNCVKAYETTAGEQIEDAQYRCAPERYAERLLFRGGVDRLDEQGEASVMIA